MLDPEDKAPILALLSRHIRIQREQAADLAKKTEIDERLKTYPAQLKKLHSAFSIFGVDTTQKGWGEPIFNAYGLEAYRDAERKGGREASVWTSRIEEPAVDESDPTPSLGADASIRDLVIERLQKAEGLGVKASELRTSIEVLRNTELHEKTIGMTLYRLSQAGLARRDGRTWFYVSPQGEAKNPDADTSGSESMRQHRKEHAR